MHNRPSLSRIMAIQFDKQAHQDTDAEMNAQYYACLQLLSSCYGDLSTLLHKQQLDSVYIQDCISFMGQALGVDRDRKANDYGRLLYFWILMEVMLLNAKGLPDAIMFCVQRAAFEMECSENEGSRIEYFLRLTWEAFCRRTNTQHDPLREINVHCFIEHAKRSISNTEYYGIRLETVCAVLGKIDSRVCISANEIRQLVAGKDDLFVFDRCNFYDTKDNQWPPNQTIDESMMSSGVFKTTRARCLLVNKPYFDKVVNGDPENRFNPIAVKDVHITNENRVYNFYNAVTTLEWEGLRVLEECSFTNMCCRNRPEAGEYNVCLERQAVSKGFADFAATYNMQMLMSVYKNRKLDDDDDDLSPLLRCDPFVYVNAPGMKRMPLYVEVTRRSPPRDPDDSDLTEDETSPVQITPWDAVPDTPDPYLEMLDSREPSPEPLSSVDNTSQPRGKKRSRFIADEASDGEDEGGERDVTEVNNLFDQTTLEQWLNYRADRCTNIYTDVEGRETECGNLKNSAEQLCKSCVRMLR